MREEEVKNIRSARLCEILVQAEEKFGPEDAVRYKVSRDEIGAKSYSQLKKDSESFSCVLQALGEIGKHVAVIGMTSYPWLVSYLERWTAPAWRFRLTSPSRRRRCAS